MRQVLRLALSAAALSAAFALPLVTASTAKEAPVYATTKEKLAVSGYDPVVYFTTGKPGKGLPTIRAEYNGAVWQFADEANKQAFVADPAKYAPQYGGYCAWAVSQGYTASADPNAWKIVNGKLYLNYNRSVASDWEKNIPVNIANGDRNWPKVLQK